MEIPTIYTSALICFFGNIFSTVRSVKGTEECLTIRCLETAAKVYADVEKKYDKCDNFYKFACGEYLDRNDMPYEDKLINPRRTLTKSVTSTLGQLLNETIQQNDLKPFKLMKELYSGCVNDQSDENENEKTLLSKLEELGGWPVLKGEAWNEKDFDWRTVTYKAQALGFEPDYFVKFSVDINVKNNSEYLISMDQPEVGLPREEFLNGASPYLKAYGKYMVDVAVAFGAKREYAETELTKVKHFEQYLSYFLSSTTQRQKLHRLYNEMAIEEIENFYPRIITREFINKMLGNYYTLNVDDRIVVKELDFFQDLQTYLKRTDKRVIANFVFWKLIQRHIILLNENVRNQQTDFFKIATGQVEREARWEECVKVVQNYFPLASGALYVRNTYNAQNGTLNKKMIEDMIDHIRNEFKSNLKTIDWLDAQTKEKISLKSDLITYTIGYPDEFYNNKLIESYYDTISFQNKDSTLAKALKVSIFNKRKSLMLLNRKVNRTAWYHEQSTTLVDTFYNYEMNNIELPAAILQDIFYNPEQPDYANYGAIGALIGNEIVHAFDYKGRQYNSTGHLVYWWPFEAKSKFQDKIDCFIMQYSDYDLHGFDIVNENMADNGGVRAAYFAYRKLLENPNYSERMFPGQTYTPNQLFWLSYAQMQCTKYRSEELFNIIAHSYQSPAEFRVNGVVSNIKEFAHDFNCGQDTKMNPTNKCAIW